MSETWKLLVVESPYAGDVARNVAFCEAVCRYAVSQGYAPYASHLIFTRFLDDAVPEERQAGIDGGLAWAKHAELAWFCLRPGEEMSNGMRYARERHKKEGRPYRVLRFTQGGELLGDETPPREAYAVIDELAPDWSGSSIATVLRAFLPVAAPRTTGGA